MLETYFSRACQALSTEHGVPLANTDFYLSLTAANLSDEDNAKSIGEKIQKLTDKHGKPGLIVIDTLARNFGPGDENSTKDMSKFIHNIDTHVGLNTTRILVHHTGKSNTDVARGAYALKAAVDAEYKIFVAGESVVMKNTKMKDSESPEIMIFQKKKIKIDDENDSLVLEKIDSIKSENLQTSIQKMREYINNAKPPLNKKGIISKYEDFGYAKESSCASALRREIQKGNYIKKTNSITPNPNTNPS